MKRKLSVKKYLLAFILTLVIFSGGVFIGILLENARLQEAKQITLYEKLNLQSLQLQQKYIESGIAECGALNKILETNINDLTRKMEHVISYERKSFFNEEEFNLQLREYFLTEMQFLLTSQEIDKKCQRNSLKIIYFYDATSQDDQGAILDYLKKLFGGKILVFSFNSEFKDEPMINILLTSYNIKKFPAVVVENKVFQGFTSIDILKKTICSQLKLITRNSLPECQTSL